MLGKLIAAQMALEKAIAALTASGASAGAATSQLSRITGLQASVGTADAAALAAIKGEVASAVAQSKTIAADARAEAAGAPAGSAIALAEARQTAQVTIAELNDDLYKRKIFDRYLGFKSAEDELAYREREEENRRAIAAARAKGTPEGDLEALAIERRQLLDAGAHGADRSPEWRQRIQQTETSSANLSAAMVATGYDTKSADAIDRESTRTFLKAKGLSDAEINHAMKSGRSTAEVIEPYLAKASETPAPSPEKPGDGNKPTSPQLKEVADALRAAGVVSTDGAASDGHGVQIATKAAGTLKLG